MVNPTGTPKSLDRAHTRYSQGLPETARGTLGEGKRPDNGDWEQIYEGLLLGL